MQIIRKYKILVIVSAVVLALWMVRSDAAERNVDVYTTGEYKSDMARMVEAYEKLSTQYLAVVQQNLSMMNFNDQQVLEKLAAIEKKIDILTEKVDTLQTEGPQPLQPEMPTKN